MVFYGDEWALTEGVKGVMQYCWPEVEMVSVSGVSALESAVYQDPRAGVLLCLRPHMNVPVLDALRPLLRGRVVSVVSAGVLFSDRMVARGLGYREPVNAEALEAWLPGSVSVRGSHPLEMFMQEVERDTGWRRWQERRGKALNEMSAERTRHLLNELRGYMVTALPEGVSLRQWFILCRFAEGLSGAEVSQMTGLKEKTVSLYRRQTLKQLGMERVKCGMGLYRAVQVRESLQIYPGGVRRENEVRKENKRMVGNKGGVSEWR